MPNVLWVSGAPGAGKTAFSSTITTRLFDHGYASATFRIKRGSAKLADPRCMWRSVAFQLAKEDAGIKHALLEALSRDDHIHPERFSIKEQFGQLICKTVDSMSSRKIIVVIDALDECDDLDALRVFLETIIEWSKLPLPQTCKLIVTSRMEPVIEKELRDISHRLDLETGKGCHGRLGRRHKTLLQDEVQEYGGPT